MNERYSAFGIDIYSVSILLRTFKGFVLRRWSSDIFLYGLPAAKYTTQELPIPPVVVVANIAHVRKRV
jgi:hypothetical protein